MNRQFINFLKIKIKRKIFIRNEVKKKILKSIIQNHKIKPIKRQYSYYKLIRISNLFLKIKNTCLLTGRNTAVSKNFFISRHSIKKMININKLQNVKINSW